jgi:hypothetical protein
MTDYINSIASVSTVKKTDVEKVILAMKENHSFIRAFMDDIGGLFVITDNPPVRKMITEARDVDSILNYIVRGRLRGSVKSQDFDETVDRYSELVKSVTEFNNSLRSRYFSKSDNKKSNNNDNSAKKQDKKESAPAKQPMITGDPLGV